MRYTQLYHYTSEYVEWLQHGLYHTEVDESTRATKGLQKDRSKHLRHTSDPYSCTLTLRCELTPCAYARMDTSKPHFNTD